MPGKLRPIHPGEVPKSVLQDAGVSAHRAALDLRIPANRLTEIVNGKRAITADTAICLGRYFGTSAEMWLNLRAKYDLQRAEEKIADRVAEEVRPFKIAWPDHGVLAGLAASPARTRHVSSPLFGVRAHDKATFAVSAIPAWPAAAPDQCRVSASIRFAPSFPT